jgi:putative ABC transport system permease protein
VAADVRDTGIAADPGPEMYLPAILRPPQTLDVGVRTAGNPMRMAAAIRGAVRAIDRDEAASDVQTEEQVLDASLGQRHLTLLLLEIFAGVALLLSLLGIYGAIAYSVAQRTQEVGIRRALGAQHGDILRLVLIQALGLTAAGLAIGIGGAVALTRVMRSLLFHVSATDPATFAGVALFFAIVALAAGLVPARRAATIDPMAALR